MAGIVDCKDAANHPFSRHSSINKKPAAMNSGGRFPINDWHFNDLDGGSRWHDDYDFGPSVALPVPEMVLGGASAWTTGAAGGSVGLAVAAQPGAFVRLVSASGPAAKPASVRILSMIGLTPRPTATGWQARRETRFAAATGAHRRYHHGRGRLPVSRRSGCREIFSIGFEPFRASGPE